MVVILPATHQGPQQKLQANASLKQGSQAASSVLFNFKNQDDQTQKPKIKGPFELVKDLFLHLGYFTYDTFLLLTQSFPALASFTQRNKFIKNFSIGVEVLCTISNTWISGSKAYERTHSTTKTTFMVIEEAFMSLFLGLILPPGIIHGTQKAFASAIPAFKHPMGKMLSGLLAIIGIERAMHGFDQLAEKLVYKNEQTEKIAEQIDGFLAQKSAV